jgi:hypothetical protein
MNVTDIGRATEEAAGRVTVAWLTMCGSAKRAAERQQGAQRSPRFALSW